MEENKYYTPTQEEIHFGFEFEARYKDKPWVKGIADEDFFDTDFDTAPVVRFGAVDNKRSDVEFRVKYLDKEDIESEGFEFLRTNEKVNLFQRNIIFIKHRIEDNWIEIENNRGSAMHLRGDVFFSGKINNKSEFKKILKMIGVQ